MSEEKVPNELRYTKSHEWVKVDGESATVGVTDHAQAQLTDIVFVDLPATGKSVAKGGSVLVLESVKTVADVYAPERVGDGGQRRAEIAPRVHQPGSVREGLDLPTSTFRPDPRNGTIERGRVPRFRCVGVARRPSTGP